MIDPCHLFDSRSILAILVRLTPVTTRFSFDSRFDSRFRFSILVFRFSILVFDSRFGPRFSFFDSRFSLDSRSINPCHYFRFSFDSHDSRLIDPCHLFDSRSILAILVRLTPVTTRFSFDSRFDSRFRFSILVFRFSILVFDSRFSCLRLTPVTLRFSQRELTINPCHSMWILTAPAFCRHCPRYCQPPYTVPVPRTGFPRQCQAKSNMARPSA